MYNGNRGRRASQPQIETGDKEVIANLLSIAYYYKNFLLHPISSVKFGNSIRPFGAS